MKHNSVNTKLTDVPKTKEMLSQSWFFFFLTMSLHYCSCLFSSFILWPHTFTCQNSIYTYSFCSDLYCIGTDVSPVQSHTARLNFSFAPLFIIMSCAALCWVNILHVNATWHSGPCYHVLNAVAIYKLHVRTTSLSLKQPPPRNVFQQDEALRSSYAKRYIYTIPWLVFAAGVNINMPVMFVCFWGWCP